MFSYLDASITSWITLGDHSCIEAEGKGPVFVLTKHNEHKYIPNFYYVPHLKNNLISVGQLMEHGYDVIFQGNTCYIYDKLPNRRLIEKVEKTNNRMFPLTLRSWNISQSFAHNVSRIDESQLWNSRYGYIPVKSLVLLQKHSIVIGIFVINEKDCNCEINILANRKRDSFPKSSSRAKEPLEIVHTYICGPIRT